MTKTKRKLIYTAIQNGILDFGVNDASLTCKYLKKKPRCLVDVILKYVMKEVRQ